MRGFSDLGFVLMSFILWEFYVPAQCVLNNAANIISTEHRGILLLRIHATDNCSLLMLDAQFLFGYTLKLD